MKRVGIITHYHRSLNYGGILQAYALTRYLGEAGYACEQICYDTSAGTSKNRSWKAKAAHMVSAVLFDRLWKKRRKVISAFRDAIPHSETVYTRNTIASCVDQYDVFITGSDQVWNLKAYHPAYFLDFVPFDRCKLSYAASLCTDHLTEEEKALYQTHLQDYHAVSVREKNAVALLEPVTDKAVEWSVDPVFLLTQSQWDDVCAERVVKGDYLFCYFLGNDRKERELARQYAREKNLKLVTIPYIHQHVSRSMAVDVGFGDIRLGAVSPEQFVSLIRHAHTVFTDSFHAAAFSMIYKKEFFVFERANEKKMASRITSILELNGTEERFCTGEKQNLAYLRICPVIDYGNNQEALEALKAESMHFLIKHIG